MKIEKLLDAVTATGAGQAKSALDASYDTDNRTFQCVGATTAGSGACSVEIDVSNDNQNWLALGTITLSLTTTPSTDGFVSNAAWAYVRADVKSISGTGANVTCYMGV